MIAANSEVLTWLMEGLALAAGLAFLLFRRSGRVRAAVTLTLLPVAAFGTWQYVNFGSFHTYTTGSAHYHAHDFTHYYLGSKYFTQLGYKGLYLAVAAAFEELAAEGRLPADMRIGTVRDLGDKRRFIKGEDVALQGRPFRERFSGGEWERFKGDVEFLVGRARGADWEKVLLDAGYNPSPLWTLYGYSISRIIPLDPSISLVISLDTILLAAIFVLLAWAAGLVPALLALSVFVYFPAGFYSSYNFAGGSFLRYSWLFWLVLAWIFFHRKRFFPAGFCFGVAALERVFPVLFFLAALWPLLWEARAKRHEWRRWLTTDREQVLSGGFPFNGYRMVSGFLLSFLGLLGLTSALFGPGSWTAFMDHIGFHSSLYFANIIGLKKAGVFTPEVQNLSLTVDIPARFTAWTGALQRRWEMWPLNRVVQVLLIALSAVASLRLPRVVCSAFLGSVLLFCLTMTAHYYHVYLAVFMALLLIRHGEGGDVEESARVRERIVWLYGVTSLYLLTSNFLYLQDRKPMVTFFYVSIVMLAACLSASLGLLMSRKKALPLILSLLVAGYVAGSVRARPIDNSLPPPPYRQDALPLEFLSSGTPARLAFRFMDVFGHVVEDTGIRLAKGSTLAAGWYRDKGGAGKIVIRSDINHSGTLTVSVNRRWKTRIALVRLGTVFDYIEVDVPAEAFVEGRNFLVLGWDGEERLGIYSSWLI